MERTLDMFSGLGFKFCVSSKRNHLTLDELENDKNNNEDLFNRDLLCACQESDILPDSGDTMSKLNR
jgi:hypothetical protein